MKKLLISSTVFSLRLFSWGSRRSQFCFNNCSWRSWWYCRRRSSAWARWSSSCWDSIISLQFLYTSSVIISLEFVFSNLRLTVSEDLLPLSVQESPNRFFFRVLSLNFVTFHNTLPFSIMTFVIVHNGLPRSILRHRRRRQTRRQAFSFGVFDLSSVCVKEHLTDCGVVVIHVFGEPLLEEPLLDWTRRKSLWGSSRWAHNLWRKSSCH